MSGTVLDGSLLLAVPIAVLAGLVSFLSPCVLPLVPGYLGYVTGLTGIDLERQRRGRMLAGAALFVAGFTAVYVTMGWAAGWVGAALQTHQQGLTRVLGVVTVALGLVFLGLLPGTAGSAGPDRRPAAGLAGAPLLGATFGLGWTACTGPTLSAIVALAGLGGSPARGALLATAYCAGLGVPFLLTGGGPAFKTEVVAIYTYRTAFQFFRFGMGSAVGMVMMLINLAFAVVCLGMLRSQRRVA